MPRRLAALAALLSFGAGLALLVFSSVDRFPWGLVSVGLLALAAVLGWTGLLRRGRSRTVLWVLAAVALVAAVAVPLLDGVQLVGLVGIALVLVAVAAARRAFSVHVRLPRAVPPERAVVVYNVKSGGGKAVSSHLADEARKRGITPRELHPGEDWAQVVRDLVAGGADGLMAAGGDGTQALVATIAAEHDLPFACIPAGTRNHFALDLGVDRDDVVGALDAFVDGGEKRVDLGEVGGRVFVNNVSLGLYAEAVQSEGYRDAKIRTILDTVPSVLAPGGGEHTRELRWTGPDGRAQRSAAVVLVSNNVYRLGTVLGSGTRPRMDAGQLGVTVAGRGAAAGEHRHLVTEWATPEFVIDSDGDVPVGVDGEALMMPTPLVFRVRPGVLRVRIAPQHPGASPAAALPTGLADAARRLVRIAGGADPATLFA